MRLWERKDLLWSHPCRAKTFTPQAAHMAFSSRWYLLESQALFPLVIPQNHVGDQRANLGWSECFAP